MLTGFQARTEGKQKQIQLVKVVINYKWGKTFKGNVPSQNQFRWVIGKGPTINLSLTGLARPLDPLLRSGLELSLFNLTNSEVKVGGRLPDPEVFDSLNLTGF